MDPLPLGQPPGQATMIPYLSAEPLSRSDRQLSEIQVAGNRIGAIRTKTAVKLGSEESGTGSSGLRDNWRYRAFRPPWRIPPARTRPRRRGPVPGYQATAGTRADSHAISEQRLMPRAGRRHT